MCDVPSNPLYLAEFKTLNSNMKSKVRRILRQNRVVPCGQGHYLVIAEAGYNVTDYEINLNNESCNCQNNALEGRKCTHIIACMMYEYQERGTKHEN